MDPDPADAPLASRRAVAYSGTSVVGGRGEGIVVAIGRATEFGRIAGGLASRERRRSPLQRELDRLVRILLVVAVGLIVFTSGMGFLRGHPLGENVLAGISSAIAAIPEEPPVLLAVILGLGAYRLLKRGVLVRRLNAEETLGAVDLIVTDKTGTSPRTGSRCHRSGRSTGPSRTRPARRGLLEEAPRAEEDAWPGEGVAPASFTRPSGAVADAGGRTELDVGSLVEAVPASDALPVTRTHARRDGHVEGLALAAPEIVLAYVEAGSPATTAKGRWADLIDSSAATGRAARRAGAPASTTGPGRCAPSSASPTRSGPASPSHGDGPGAGIQVVVVTGDHPRTAATIAREAGLQADSIATARKSRAGMTSGSRRSSATSTSWPARRPTRSCASCEPPGRATASWP